MRIHHHLWKSLVCASLALSAGCDHVCCVDEQTGETSLVRSDEACPIGKRNLGPIGSSGRENQEQECTSLAQAAGFAGENTDITCEVFCDAVQQVCPDDTECEHSCEDITGDGFTQITALDCAESAKDCTGTNQCFQLL